nr:ribonucleases p/mrp protein subunit pop1 [Quercus suber]
MLARKSRDIITQDDIESQNLDSTSAAQRLLLMAQDLPVVPSKKRKTGPTDSNSGPNKKPKPFQRSNFSNKRRDARTLSTQTTGKAFKNGELDVDQFVKAREYEIRALEDGLVRSKKALNQRAFQQVPKALRRRTASHNAKKVPKRLRKRAEKEMVEDNTPTVSAKTRKKSGHMRLRLDTVKRLRAMNSRKKSAKAGETGIVNGKLGEETEDMQTIKTRASKIKRASLAQPSAVKAKFRKRQIHKSWLPTHMYHAKRAHMTTPSQPLWRFSIPLSPTEKSYRPTHRASTVRGCVAWDTSYQSTIGLEGPEGSLVSMLRGMSVEERQLTGREGDKWRCGKRVLETFVFEREKPHHPIAPVTMIWCPRTSCIDIRMSPKRKLILRVQPSAFFQVWEEILRLAKIAKPQISVEDLRFEIGSIEVVGPGSTEALLGALWPSDTAKHDQLAEAASKLSEDGGPKFSPASEESVGSTWTSLAGLTNPSTLPANALLGFCVQDPRLHHPPQTIKLPTTDQEQSALIDLLSNWPVDKTQQAPDIFDRRARSAASAALPSQKTINRRKALAIPGHVPGVLPKDPKIPVLLYTSSIAGAPVPKILRHSQKSWTILLPWRCVQPVWYSIMYYPLSSGGQPHLGGLNQKRQLAFEASQPWFPADFPGTKAGWQWELDEREKRKDTWERRPKSKRVSWEKVDLGGAQKGELGTGWACDWDLLREPPPNADRGLSIDITTRKTTTCTAASSTADSDIIPAEFSYLPATHAEQFLRSRAASSTSAYPTPSSLSLVTVRLALITRGVPQTCARIYRLPSDPSVRKTWLALRPNKANRAIQRDKTAPPRFPRNAPAHQVRQFLARELLTPAPTIGDARYPVCPGAEDLIGFVTTGNFNLSEGQGIGVGSVLLAKILDGMDAGDQRDGNLCIVRNSGEGVGRLAKWEIV